MGGRKEVQERGDRGIPMADPCEVWQKPVQHCKVIILQLKINLKIKFKNLKKTFKKKKLTNWVRQ